MPVTLVTGGTGVLGSRVVPRLAAAGHDVRVLSRHADGPGTVRGDLTTGAGLDEAVRGVGVIVHCASGTGSLRYATARATDVDGTRRLLASASPSTHVVHISIVGIDRIPLGYYRAKLEGERVIETSGLPFTILRTTQWHTLLDELFRRGARAPVMALPRGMRVQPMHPDVVADRMAELAGGAPGGHVAPMGGPEVRDAADLARVWVRHVGRRTPVIGIPLPGRTAAAFRARANCAPEHATPGPTYEEWLATSASRSA